MKNLLLFPFLIGFSLAQSHKILESTPDHIKIEFIFEGAYKIEENIIDGKKFNNMAGYEFSTSKPGEPWLPSYNINIGIPHKATPVIKVLNVIQEKVKNIFLLPVPDSLNQPFEMLSFNKDIYNSNSYFPASLANQEDFVFRYIHIAGLSISPYQFNPVSRELIFNKKIILQVNFQTFDREYSIVNKIQDKMTENFIKSSVVNYNIAKDFIGRTISVTNAPPSGEPYWYNPKKDYYKIYLNEEGVYRITYEMLINSGVSPNSGIQNNGLELFNNGVPIPIDVVDVNDDRFFNSGDYFQFVGKPPEPADEYTRMNIYNLNNVYWFSYQSDSLNYYNYKQGYHPSSSPLITNTIKTLRWEKDLIYQRFGHAQTDARDYWYMGYAEARDREPVRDYVYWLDWLEDSIAYNTVLDKRDVKIRVGMHGLTSTSCSEGNGHDVTIKFNTRLLGRKQWNGQEPAVFEKQFYRASYSSGDTVQFFVDQQKFEINMSGNICDGAQNDFVLINYIEFDYWRLNKTYPNHFYFTSPPDDFQENRYYLWRWMRDNMKIYIPARGELITNPFIANDPDKGVYFIDTISTQTEYYCVADDYFLTPDSIIHNISPSDLRNTANGADYIIITPQNFLSAAKRLAEFRSNNLSGFSSPRIKIVKISEIYNEFSYGLLNPFALQSFAKYTYENWQQPAPAFIVLMGDASYDYRSVFPSSKKNFIPSIPFHGITFGQLPSDNSITAVAGKDLVPDIAIGRLSCETLNEANTLVDKIVSYPGDDSKQWKENTILLASGLSYEDQLDKKFNFRSKELENIYLLPNGLSSTKVFNYPEPEDISFLGDGPRMQQEISKGAVLVNYYGHGSGDQWDLVFTRYDIPKLVNGERLPFISSISCYTAHFDNADSFGEAFTKIPGKGAIGFWGSVSVTWWPTGHFMNDSLFRQVFTNRNYIVGSAILNTVASGGNFNSMVPQICYLGDPAIKLAIPENPDFEVKPSDISILPLKPLKNDTVTVFVDIRNLGVTFPRDSVTVELFKNTVDTSNFIGEVKLPSFGQNITANIPWIPGEVGQYIIIIRVNEKYVIDEEDHSDNIASANFSVFDVVEPNIVKPVNGYFTNNDKIEFVLSDIGNFFNRDFNYKIQINNSTEFNGSIKNESPVLKATDGIVRWQTGSLMPGEYFWRAVVYDAVDTNSSPVRIFSITNKEGSGYLSQKKQLQLFDVNNIVYSDQLNSLILNTELKPPHPDERFFSDSISIVLPDDGTEASTFTTDGTYFYFAHLPPYNNGKSSKIYKYGTGLGGTTAGENYGEIPDLIVNIYSQLLYYSGSLYTCTGPLNNLLRINPQTGETSRIPLSDNLLLTLEKPNQKGGCYLYSDGKYVYNLAVGTTNYPDKFVMRIFDPAKNWEKVGEDIIFNGSTMRNVMSFFVVGGYAIIYENYFHHFLRRYRLSDGMFEEEWNYAIPARDYFNVTYDYNNNFVYFTSYSPASTPYTPSFVKYSGTYVQANGTITSQEIGPASEWNNLQFEIDQTNSYGKYKAYLLGKSRNSSNWETLDTIIQPNISLAHLDPEEYNIIKLNFEFVDSSFGFGEPMKFNSLHVDYKYLPEISMFPGHLTFSADSMLQGIDVDMNLRVYNIGYIPADSLKLNFYLNNGTNPFFSKYLSLQPDSFKVIEQAIKTDTVIFETKVRVVAVPRSQEYHTFNNLVEKSFYVARDSIKPTFKITFDGKEILDGDIISAKPVVSISLKDNGPLPLDESLFTIVHNNKPLVFIPDTLIFNYKSYPNSEVLITWTPSLPEGSNTLEVLAKDASGNFFDTTSYRINFFVYSEPDLREVYNFPNPFGEDTYFTFELRGTDVPDELKIKVYTIAGRLIRDINIPPSLLRVGFNRIHWDGRDNDGDRIANGVYFYKVIYKNKDVVKTVTQKLAKVQ